MKEKFITGIKFIIFLSIGVFLLWLAYRNYDMNELWIGLKSANFYWIALSMLVSLGSHWMRAVRWNLLIEPLGYKPKKLNTFCAVMIMYLANFAIPRMGEVTRCGVMKQYEKVPFTQLLGTVLIERSVDMLVLIFLFIIVLLTQFWVIVKFLKNNPAIIANLDKLKFSGFVALIAGVIFIILVIVFWKKLKATKMYQKIEATVNNFVAGIKTVFTMQRKISFLINTFAIWFLYFLNLYICFQAFGATQNLPVLAGLAGIVIGSFGMVAPVQGGIGAWHIMIIQTLVVYGIVSKDGAVFAAVVHGSMMVLLVIGGFISLLILPVYNRSSKSEIVLSK